ncbi:MAG: hypothetical protein AB7R89_26750 [Dehalococcoidia bacterium]
MIAKPHPIPPHPGVPHHTRRPRRLTALERVIERAEDRFDQREARRIFAESGPEDWTPLDEIIERLKLNPER